MATNDNTEPVQAATAQALRAAGGGRVPVTLKNGLTVICRKPDVADAIVHGALPLPLLKAVIVDAELAGMLGLRPDQLNVKPETALGFVERMNPDTARFMDHWAVLATTQPRLCLEQQDATIDVLWVMELSLADKSAIFEATFNLADMLLAGGPAGATFRAGRDGGDGRPSGAQVSVPSLGAAGDR